MSGNTRSSTTEAPIPAFGEMLGHPRPLWMLFMTEFWERFAFYGIRWALVLYIVAQFHAGSASGEEPASRTYGAYLALVYAAAIFGGYVADKILGYQRSILLGAVIMASGLFMIAIPDERIFTFGLATVIVGNGLFKPNISTMVGKLYTQGDPRRDSGFTIFYMGINAGALIAPVLTGWLAEQVFGSSGMPAYKYVFIASGFGMLVSLVWFWFGRRQLESIGLPIAGREGMQIVAYTAIGCLLAIPVTWFLIAQLGATALQYVLTAMFVGLCILLLTEGFQNGPVARDKAIAMLIIFAFNVTFWMFFEQAGSSFTFLADKIVNRDFGSFTFPVAWFQTVNSHRDHHAGADRRVGMGQAGTLQPVDSAEVRPRPRVQRPGVPAADVRALEPRQRRRQDPVLDAGRGVRHPVGRRTVPLADWPLDGDQARAGAPGRLRHGRLVPVDRHRQQPVGHLRRLRERRERHDDGVSARRLHVRLLGPADRRRHPVAGRAAAEQVDAWRQVTRHAHGHGH